MLMPSSSSCSAIARSSTSDLEQTTDEFVQFARSSVADLEQTSLEQRERERNEGA